jgi:hypothetical protein
VSTPYRPCPQCGMPLVPMQGFCSNCGARFINDSSSFAQARLAPPPGATDARQMQLPSTPANGQPFSPYNGAQYGSNGYGNGGPVYTQSPPPNMGYLPSTPYATGEEYPPSGPYAGRGGYPPSNPYEMGQEAGQYAQQPSAGYPRNARKRPRRRKVNFLLPVLAFLVVIALAGIGLFA